MQNENTLTEGQNSEQTKSESALRGAACSASYDSLMLLQWRQWAFEICADFKIEYDPHDAGLRSAITKRLANMNQVGGCLVHWVKAARRGDSPLIHASVVESIDHEVSKWDSLPNALLCAYCNEPIKPGQPFVPDEWGGTRRTNAHRVRRSGSRWAMPRP